MRKAILALAILFAVTACDSSSAIQASKEAAQAQALGGKSVYYEAFEVKEFGLVCVAHIRAISCVSK